MKISELFLKIKIFIIGFFNRALLKLYSSGGFGYFTGSLGGGKEVGQPGRIPSFVFNIGDWQLHFHHWLIGSAILISAIIFLIKKHKLNYFLLSPIFGFLLGLIVHGILRYDDWHKILTKIG